MSFDFESNMRSELIEQFTFAGIKHPKGRLDDILMDYLTLRKKLIPSKTRIVKYSPDLLTLLPTHQKKSEILFLEKSFTNGGNVNPFQNSKLLQTKFHDHLAYEWNIFHFHLSLEKDKKTSFAKQVKQLLFVYIADEEAIFLGVDNHLEGTFGDVKWLEILHDYFPYTIEPHLDKNINEVYPDPNGVGRQTLWDKGYSLVATNIRGKVYLNPGLGRTTSGHSLQVSMQALDIVKWVYKITKQFEMHSDQIIESLNLEKTTVKFFLKFTSTFEIRESQYNKAIISYPNVFVESIQT